MGNDSKGKNSFLEGGTMSHPVNDEIFERLYEEVTEEWLENIRKNSYTKYGKPYIPVESDLDQDEVKEEVMKRFWEIAQ